MLKNFIKKIEFKKKIRRYRKSMFIGGNIEKKCFKKRKKNKQLKINFIKINKKKLYVFYIIIIVIGVIIIIITLFVSSVFSIKNVNIIKKDNITDINIAYKSIEDIRGKSIFLIDRKKIKESLQSYQKNIQESGIEIRLPNTIKILIGSYRQLFNTKIGEKNYIIVENGVLIPFKPSKQLKSLKIIGEIQNNGIIDYRQVLVGEYLQNIEKIIEGLEKNIIGIKIKDLNYYITEREIHIFLENNNRLIFDLTENIKEQIEKIAIFNKEKFNLKNKKIFYIDIRIKNKIFYCPIEQELICNNNIKKIYTK